MFMPFFLQVNHKPRSEYHSKTRSQSDPSYSLTNHVYFPNPDNTSRKGEESFSENMLRHSVTHETMPNNDLSKYKVENSHKDIESKLEAMENYLDGFYTKAKSDVRSIRKLIQDEKMGTWRQELSSYFCIAK